MTQEIAQLIEQLKTAETAPKIACVTVKLLRACGVFNYQGVAREMARMCVTGCDKQQ